MISTLPLMPLHFITGMIKKEKKVFLFLTMLVLLSGVNFAQCVAPSVSIGVQPGAATCNGQSFNLILSNATAGTAPFDLTVEGPGGISTYNDVPVGGVITNFVPPTEKLWPANPPVIPPTNDDASVTLGVKFRSTVPGFVKGVRFFSCDDITPTPGSYTGQLWTTSGTLLASGTFNVSTNNAWQELLFATPVLISANTTYIASYHTTGSKYVGTPGGFTAPFSNGSLTAPDNVSSGGNGVYAYGPAASFPANSVGGNYWVDVMFSPNVYEFNLTDVKDANECISIGALQTLTINAGDCSVLPVNLVVNSPATTTVGQSFTVYVAADFTGSATPSGIDELELHLAFDNSKLAVTSITEEPIAAAFTSKPIPLEGSPYANVNATGQIDYAASTTGSIPVNDFNILAITFLVTGGEGSATALTLRSDAPSNETKAMSNGNTVLSAVINGNISISAANCIAPVATIGVQPGSVTCNGQAFNLVLSGSTVGTAPFDLTISGPAGTATYNDIPVGGIITSFTPPTESLWPAVPAILPATNEDASVTLGVKFSSSVSGFVKGVRFFSPDNIAIAPGSYTGQLWSADGTLLASGTFTGVTTSNWQELVFTTPVLISANTTYIASYHTTGNTYVGTPNGFANAFTNGSLTAADNSSAGGNGVYAYGGTPVFPSNSVGGNYWVDVLFFSNVYTFNLTGVQDAMGCTNTGALQTLTTSAGSCSGASLPVTLINFSATPKDNNIILRWTTSSENNNLGFEIQRSLDGVNWSVLSFVNGAGNSNSILKYIYDDEKLVSSKRYYYRLKQIDIDQRFAYSPVVSAILDFKEGFSLEQNYPNPVMNETVIRFTLPQKATVMLSLFDMNGRMVKVLMSETKETGTHVVNLNGGALTKGIYFYKLQAGNLSAMKKMIIQ